MSLFLYLCSLIDIFVYASFLPADPFFQPGDFLSGYYRDQTLAFATGKLKVQGSMVSALKLAALGVEIDALTPEQAARFDKEVVKALTADAR